VLRNRSVVRRIKVNNFKDFRCSQPPHASASPTAPLSARRLGKYTNRHGIFPCLLVYFAQVSSTLWDGYGFITWVGKEPVHESFDTPYTCTATSTKCRCTPVLAYGARECRAVRTSFARIHEYEVSDSRIRDLIRGRRLPVRPKKFYSLILSLANL
jgi:hypothetical protein